MQNQNGPPPENHLVWAILSTVMCCLPLGIVAIVKSTKVNELWAIGDTVGAQKAANDAKKYAIWSAALFPVFFVIVFVISMVLGIAGALLDA